MYPRCGQKYPSSNRKLHLPSFPLAASCLSASRCSEVLRSTHTLSPLLINPLPSHLKPLRLQYQQLRSGPFHVQRQRPSMRGRGIAEVAAGVVLAFEMVRSLADDGRYFVYEIVMLTGRIFVVQTLHVVSGATTAGRQVLRGSSSNAKMMEKLLDMSIVVCSRVIACYEALQVDEIKKVRHSRICEFWVCSRMKQRLGCEKEIKLMGRYSTIRAGVPETWYCRPG